MTESTPWLHKLFGAVLTRSYLLRRKMEELAAAGPAHAGPAEDPHVRLSDGEAVDDEEASDALSAASLARRRTGKLRKVKPDDSVAEGAAAGDIDDAAMVNAANEAEAKHALVVANRKHRPVNDSDSLIDYGDEEGELMGGSEFNVNVALKDLSKNPHYFRNMPVEEWTVRFRPNKHKTMANQPDWTAWPSHACFSSDRLPYILPPPAPALFPHMWPGGNLAKFCSPDEQFPAESTKDAHFSFGHNLNYNEETKAWKNYVIRMEEIILDKILAHEQASQQARQKAANARKDYWPLKWAAWKREIQAKDMNAWTDEERKLMAFGGTTPPIPFSELKPYILENCVTRSVKFRRIPDPNNPGGKINEPGTEYMMYKRPMFHVPNEEEKKELVARQNEHKPMFDMEYLESLDKRIVPYVLDMAAQGDLSRCRLLTEIPLIQPSREGYIVPSYERHLFLRNDFCHPMLLPRINLWTVKETMGLKWQPHAVLWYGAPPASNPKDQIIRLIQQFPVRGGDDFRTIAPARKALLAIEAPSDNKTDAGAGAAAESFPQ